MPLLTLRHSHLAILVAGLATVIVVVWIAFMPQWQALYIREVEIPKLERDYGFRGGPVQYAGPGSESWGIVHLPPDSRLTAFGLRPRDIPLGHHGGSGGTGAMHDALRAGERRKFASFDVLNADDLARGDYTMRTIVVFPPGAVLPRTFHRSQGQLISPNARFSLVAEESIGAYELRLRDLTTGSTANLHTFTVSVSAVWSPDEKWIALTDAGAEHPSRCWLIEPMRGTRVDLSALVTGLPAVRREFAGTRELNCEIFGWVSGTSSVAFQVWREGAATAFPGHYVIDVSTWAITDARIAAFPQ